jgi:hypothetical protein
MRPEKIIDSAEECRRVVEHDEVAGAGHDDQRVIASRYHPTAVSIPV